MSGIQLTKTDLDAAGRRLVARFIDKEPPFEIFMELNETLIQATGSEYGFIARAYKNENGPYIKTLAVTNIAWNDETRRLYAENAERGMVFENLDTLFGQVLKTGKIFISHDAAKDPHAGGVPVGHPPLNRFLGIPLLRKGVLIGMIGLANGDSYSKEQVGELEDLLAVTTDIVFGTGFRTDLESDGDYFLQPQSILNTLKSGVLSVDSQGQVVSTNPAATAIFGFATTDLTKMRVQSLIPPTGDDRIYDHLGEFQPTDEILGETCEVTAVNRQGSFFPLELSIQRVEETIEPKYAVVVRDLTEEKKNERLKNEFISIVSHELRTPLTAAHTAISILADSAHKPSDEDTVNYLIRVANRNCERLVGLIDEILDFEKLSAGKLKFNFASVALEEVFEQTQQMTSILADHESVSLRFELPESPLLVAADTDRIAQVLVNLIANAIRVSDSGQGVRIGVTAPTDSSIVTVFVEDQGAGISPENQKKIFEPFTQFSNDGSAGLGLAICKRIVDNHNSSIRCHSTVGEGTRFSFDLFVDQGLAKEFPDASQQGHASQHGHAGSVLWVDENEQQFRLASCGLTLPGCEIYHVSNSPLAKSCLNRTNVDLIVLAHPVALGATESLVNEIRQVDRFADIPIVVFGSGLSSELTHCLRDMNVDCDIRSSWNWTPLHDKIKTYMN